MTETKECSRCEEPKKLAAFSADGHGGFRSICRACDTAYHRERRRKCLATSPSTRVAKPDTKPSPPPQPIQQEARSSHTYLITYAQNATPVHEDFLKSLEVFAKENDAVILAIPGRYKNPTSLWSSKMEHDEWWDERLHPYLFNGRMLLGDKISVFGDISIQPTAVRPLTGFEVFVGKYSGIFGHPRLQFRTVATAQRRYPRILTTTGACTVENYTDSKAGKKGAAHHVLGACLVEESEGLYHIRQINALADGSFIDLDREYTAEGSRPAGRALALVMGDIHVDHADSAILDASLYAPDSIASVLKPEKIVLHDVLDMDVRSHHTIGNFFDRYDRVKGLRSDDVSSEVSRVVRFIDSIPEGSDPFVVASNHDEAIEKWLLTADPRLDPVNAKFFHATWAGLLTKRDQTGDWMSVLEMWYRQLSKDNRAIFIKRDQPFEVGGIHLPFHGDRGINGARGGGGETFSKLGVKTVTAHVHGPGIYDGATVVGVSGDLDQGYNGIPSSWMHTHCSIYPNGKRSLLTLFHRPDGNGAIWRRPR